MREAFDRSDLTVAEAAMRSGRSKDWVYACIRMGRLPAARSAGLITVAAGDVDRLLRNETKLSSASQRRQRRAEARRRQFKLIVNAE